MGGLLGLIQRRTSIKCSPDRPGRYALPPPVPTLPRPPQPHVKVGVSRAPNHGHGSAPGHAALRVLCVLAQPRRPPPRRPPRPPRPPPLQRAAVGVIRMCKSGQPNAPGHAVRGVLPVLVPPRRPPHCVKVGVPPIVKRGL